MSEGVTCLVSLAKGVKQALLDAELADDTAQTLAEATDLIQVSLETINNVLLPQVPAYSLTLPVSPVPRAASFR